MWGRKESVSEGTPSNQALNWFGLELERRWVVNLDKAMTIVAYELEYVNYEISELDKKLGCMSDMVADLLTLKKHDQDVPEPGDSGCDDVVIIPMPKKKDCAKEILKVVKANPDASVKQIADAVGCSTTYVRRILKKNRKKLPHSNMF